LDSTTQIISIIILLVAFVALVIATQVIRRRRQAFPMRVIPAYEGLPLMIGAAIEANTPVHMSFGSAGLGGGSTLLALANAELFYRAGQRAAIGATSPIISTSDSTAIPLAYDTLRRAYESREMLRNYTASGVRWFPQGPRSLGFAAGATAMMGIEKVNANIMVGSFGPELALIAESAARHNQSLIAASDQLEGQAVAYAMSDQPLIGEEIFAAGAYLGQEASQKAVLVTQDLLRWLLIVILILASIASVNEDIAPIFGEILAALGAGR
jgi:hypothetical protein